MKKIKKLLKVVAEIEELENKVSIDNSAKKNNKVVELKPDLSEQRGTDNHKNELLPDELSDGELDEVYAAKKLPDYESFLQKNHLK